MRSTRYHAHYKVQHAVLGEPTRSLWLMATHTVENLTGRLQADEVTSLAAPVTEDKKNGKKEV